MSKSPLLHRFARMDELETRLLARLREAGYRRIYTPTFASLSDYAARLGEEVRTEFLTFVLADEQVLRPEFTTKVVQAALATTEAPGAPMRLAYSGPTFRVHRQTGPFPHEFQQLGGELVGGAAPAGDAEILRTLDQLAAESGTGPWEIRLSHAALLDSLLVSVGCSATLAARIRQELHRLGRHRERLAGGDRLLRDVLPRMLAARTRRLEGLSASLPSPDSADAILAWEKALLEREWQAAGAPSAALALVSTVYESAGTLERVESWATHVAGSGAAGPLAELRACLAAAPPASLPNLCLSLDPSVVRDLSYYTGIVFDIAARGEGPSVVIGGGGRYDRLVEALGGDSPRPAIGFALDVGALAGISQPDLPQEAP